MSPLIATVVPNWSLGAPSEAMNCTAFGLIVAIIGLIGFAWLNGKTQGIVDDIHEATVQVLNLVVNNRSKVNLQGMAA